MRYDNINYCSLKINLLLENYILQQVYYVLYIFRGNVVTFAHRESSETKYTERRDCCIYFTFEFLDFFILSTIYY